MSAAATTAASGSSDDGRDCDGAETMSDEVFNDDGSLRCNLCRNEPCTCGRQPVRAETMRDDLIERLRWWGTERCGQPDGTLCDEAAAEIERLRAENKALMQPAYEIQGSAVEEILRLRAELAALQTSDDMYYIRKAREAEAERDEALQLCSQHSAGEFALAMKARVEKAEAELQAGRDLIAVVQRDGGHRREDVGDRQAADEAIDIVNNDRVERDALVRGAISDLGQIYGMLREGEYEQAEEYCRAAANTYTQALAQETKGA